MRIIYEYEQKLYDMWNNGVSPNSKFFKKELSFFIESIYEKCNDIDIEKLKLLVLDEKGLSREEAKVLTFLSTTRFIVATTNRHIFRNMKIGSSWMAYTRLSLLQAARVIKLLEFDKLKIIYLHPRLIEKWNKRQRQ